MILAQLDPRLNFFGKAPYSLELWGYVTAVVVLGIALIVAMTKLPTRARKPLIWTSTFLAGGFYVLYWLWPQPVGRGPLDLPRNSVEAMSFWMSDAQVKVADVANILTAFLLCLGIYSLLRVHTNRILRKHEDRFFSWVLIASMFGMLVLGYIDWRQRTFLDKDGKLLEMANWGFAQFGKDLLFDGLFQQMDAAMFSMIAFFILSAAYRAFRIRSVEATVLMISALILIISIMGAVVYGWNNMITSMLPVDSAPVLNNFKISEIANWVRSTLQTPAIRAVEFGVGLGALAMGLRLWLGLEKGGVTV
ncbi:MAG: hypothetical protein IT207_03665 [Fimbriimonadaceae bacterium]|nr:hypothetical protein [Fimbriimonadaceae bacterium]